MEVWRVELGGEGKPRSGQWKYDGIPTGKPKETNAQTVIETCTNMYKRH